MNYSKTTLACAIIIAFLLILTSTLIVLNHYEIIALPTEALVTLGIITVISPLVYLCATFSQSKVATIEEKKRKTKIAFGIYLAVAVLCCLIIAIFNKEFFLPMLLCQIPMLVFFVFMLVRTVGLRERKR